MIIKSLVLENIRSYNNTDAQIEFPEGITLFEGNIGAGKSTILYAIEFALFGLGEFKGSFLLRNGSAKGSVILGFEQDGSEYVVSRTLTKSGKGVKQESCYIKGPAGKQVLSSSEMKERVLQILKFNESPEPRAQSVIYRYAIFTPQEEMRDILKMKDPERRLQILRKAFRLESYKIAAQNSSIFSGRIRDRIGFLHGMTQDVKEKKNSLEANSANEKKLSESLVPLEQKYAETVRERAVTEGAWKNLDKQREEIEKSQYKIPILTKQVKEKREGISKHQEAIRALETKLREKIIPEIERIKGLKKLTGLSVEQLKLKKDDTAKSLKAEQDQKRKMSESASQLPLLNKNLSKAQKAFKEEKIELNELEKKMTEIDLDVRRLEKLEKPTNKTETQVKHERKDLGQRLKKLESQQAKVEERISDFEKMIKNKKCPVCERAVDSWVSDKSVHLKHEMKELQNSAKVVEKEIADLESLTERISEYLNAQDELVGVRKLEKEVKDKILKVKKSIAEFESEEQEIRTQMKQAQEDAGKLSAIDARISSAQDETNRLQELIDDVKNYEQEQKTLMKCKSDEKEANDSLKEHREEIIRLTTQIAELDQEISKIELNVKPLRGIIEKLAPLQKQLTDMDAILQKLTKAIAETKTSVGHYHDLVIELEIEVKKKENYLQTAAFLNDHKIWLDEYFIPALGNIERHVMESIRKRFNDQFERWFNLLVEDESLQVRVNEDFTPEIERDGYIQDYVALSGGERSSIALAYRLALNTLVHEVAAGSSSNLLILDEPTDGFSKEQLFKLRGIFQELRCKQIIIVSHERELEGFANNIFRIENSRGVSRIVAYNK